MELLKKTIEVTDTKNRFTIYPFSDVHQFTKAHNKEKFIKFIETVEKDKTSLTIGLGDYLEGDRPSTRKARLLQFIEKAEAYEDEGEYVKHYLLTYAVPLYKRLKHAGYGCLGLIEGDHYYQFADGSTSTQFICEQIGIPYLSLCEAYILLNFKCPSLKQTFNFKIYAQHGTKGSNVLTQDINNMVKTADFFIADLYVAGHSHRGWSLPTGYHDISSDGKHLEYHEVRMVRSGCFRNGREIGRMDYSEKEGYSPINMSLTKVNLQFSVNGILRLEEYTATT